MLVILGGLPGTGKTTVAKQLAKVLKATYLRVDTVEQALISTSKRFNPSYKFNGPEGYEILYAVARDNLLLGSHVVLDSVNPISITREAYRNIAISIPAEFIEIELTCNDVQVHKNRIQLRKPDIPNHVLPTWEEVLSREYEPWDSKLISIDTAKHSIAETVAIILKLCP